MLSNYSKIFALICTMAALGGCASSHSAQQVAPTGAASPAAAPAPHRGMMHGSMMAAMCPIQVPGTSVSVTDGDGTVALTFKSTKPDEVSELRARVRHMAEMHNQAMGNGAAGGCTMAGSMNGTGGGNMMGGGMMDGRMNGASGGMMGGGMMGGGMMGGGMMGGGMMGGATATAEDVDGGARLVFKPKDAQQLEALREQLKKAAAHMQEGQCPMMAAQADVGASDGK